MSALETGHTAPNQNSRPGPPRFIVIHHWGRDGQDFDAVVRFLCNNSREVSAHYVIGAGRRSRIVSHHKRAWHAGSDYGNDYGIGLECRPEATDEDYALVAETIAEIREAEGDLELRPHNSFTSTACPARWDLDRLDREARGLVYVAPPAPPALIAPAFPLPRRRGRLCYYGPPSGPITSVSGRGRNSLVPADVVKVGGRWHSLGLKAWQQRMRERGYSLAVDGRYGDETAGIVRYFQGLVGLTVDGKIGPATWAAAWKELIR